MIKYFKNLILSVIYWFSPPKIGRIEIEPVHNPLDQDVRREQDKIEINLEEWQDTIESVFGSDDYATEGFQRGVRPSDEVLKRQIQMFFKDYRQLNKRVDQVYTKALKHDKIDDNEVQY